MTASEALNRSGWQVPALAHARWTALLMGWVWLGQQGQRLSWSLASGLTAVVLWWAVRLCLAHWARVQPGLFRSSRSVSLVLGLCTAAGALGLSQASAGTPALMGLLGLATVWGAWCGALDQQQQNAPRCPRPWAGWPPVLAAMTTWLSVDPGSPFGQPGFVAAAVLLTASALGGWAALDRAPTLRRTCSAPRPPHHLPATAMGCMMGSLWLSNAWCTSAGWSSHTVVGLHLALMAAMPALVRMEGLPRHLPPTAGHLMPLIGVAAGAGLLWAGQTLAHGIVGMLLLALAWALPNPPLPQATTTPQSRWPQWTPLLGPVLLLAVGQWSPSSGPQVLTWAYGALGAWAAASLLRGMLMAMATRRQNPHLQR
jgi:hypothetical protein